MHSPTAVVAAQTGCHPAAAVAPAHVTIPTRPPPQADYLPTRRHWRRQQAHAQQRSPPARPKLTALSHQACHSRHHHHRPRTPAHRVVRKPVDRLHLQSGCARRVTSAAAAGAPATSTTSPQPDARPPSAPPRPPVRPRRYVRPMTRGGGHSRVMDSLTRPLLPTPMTENLAEGENSAGQVRQEGNRGGEGEGWGCPPTNKQKQ